jgi:hypothetical protein
MNKLDEEYVRLRAKLTPEAVELANMARI